MFLRYLARQTNTKIYFHSMSYDYGRSVENWRCWAFFVEVNGICYRDVLLSQQMYLLSDMLRVTISFFSSTAHLRIGRVTQSNSCSVKQLISFLQSYDPQPSGPEPRWLQDLGSHAAACVRDADPQCRRTQAVTGHWWRLERSAAQCCRRCCQRVKKVSAGVSLREGGHFKHLL